MPTDQPFDETVFRGFELAGWQRAAEHYPSAFGSLTIQKIASVLRAIEAHGTLDVGLPAGPPFFLFSDPEESRRRLQEAGFVQIEIRQLPLLWRVASPNVVVDALSRGGVRTAAVLGAQTPDALDRIRRATGAALAQYARGEIFAIPMPAVLASAAKP